MHEIITKKISKIAFGLAAPTNIKKISTVAVSSPELYDADGHPVEKGLMDLSMGVIDPGLQCKICGGRVRTCPGHFGYIRLSRPVLHVFFTDQIEKSLRCFCKECGRIYLKPDQIEKWGVKILDARAENNVVLLQTLIKAVVTQARKAKKCAYCDAAVQKIKLDKPTTFYEGDKRLWPAEIRERLEKIPDEDLELLGFDTSVARPEWMILTTLLVPPITMRPSITLLSGERSEDDLTHKLSDIVRVNQRLLENINAGAPEIIIEDLWDLLQYHITTYFNNKISQVPPARHKSNKPLKTLADRLKGKEGRFRTNLAGKRVNFCARSVLSPDPQISIDEIGVPKVIAAELTVPETVTEWNIKHIKKFIKNGDIYPGANYVVSLDGKRKKITDDTKEQILDELEPGWVVERHLVDNDIVLFNRQPSLHRVSMMAHYVKITKGRTLRINPCSVKPYNADFDGDEMNIHVPQTEEARSEAKNLLLLSKQIITPRYGLSIIGVEEDPMLGLYLLSEDMISKEDAASILIAIDATDKMPKVNKKDEISGKDIISVLLPEDLNFSDRDFIIKSGKYISGEMNSRIVGPEAGTLLHYVFKKYGSERSRKLINQLIWLGIKYTQMKPYTFSFYDLDLPTKIKKRTKAFLDEGKQEVKDIIKQYEKGKISRLPGKTLEETREAMVLSALNKIRSKVQKIIESSIPEDNNLFLMTKGKFAKLLNLSLISGIVGQQALRGSRILFGYKDRTTAHFQRKDLGPKAHGFVESTYSLGLDPIETFMHAIVGRDSLMDTAMRTPKSGYMQRRLINALQDLKVNYDGTVRDAGQKIIQFKFGGDNVDVSKSDHGGINLNVV